jgi:EpsI family protein
LIVGKWSGQDLVVDPHIRKLTAMDRCLRREYVSPEGERVLLYVVWYGNRDRGLEAIYHNPTVCYPAAGFTPVSTDVVAVPVDGRPAPVEASVDAYRSPGGVEVVVVSFIVLDEGRVFARPPRNDVVGLGMEKLRPSFSPGYFAHVQVTTEADGVVAVARERAVGFLQAVVGTLLAHF